MVEQMALVVLQVVDQALLTMEADLVEVEAVEILALKKTMTKSIMAKTKISAEITETIMDAMEKRIKKATEKKAMKTVLTTMMERKMEEIATMKEKTTVAKINAQKIMMIPMTVFLDAVQKIQMPLLKIMVDVLSTGFGDKRKNLQTNI